MLFQFLLTKFSKSELFSCLRRVFFTWSTIAKGLLYVWVLWLVIGITMVLVWHSVRLHRTSYFQPKSSSFCYVTVYVNHRPAFGLSPFDLHEAFNKLGIPGDQGFAIDRDRLLSLLQNKGMELTIGNLKRKKSLFSQSVHWCVISKNNPSCSNNSGSVPVQGCCPLTPCSFVRVDSSNHVV